MHVTVNWINQYNHMQLVVLNSFQHDDAALSYIIELWISQIPANHCKNNYT